MPQKADAVLTARERQIMDVIYQRGEATVSEVLAALADPPSYSSVRTIMGILVDKGHLRRKQDWPRYRYLPTVDRERARRSAMRHLLQTFFGGSVEQAVTALIDMSEDELPPEARARLAEKIKQARKEGR